MLKKPILLLILFYLLTGTACQPRKGAEFGIYLLSRNIPAVELPAVDINRLSLEANPIISTRDIISYDQTSHMIELTQEAFTRILGINPIPVNGTPFVVCAGDQRVYTGAFWTPVSSVSYDGVVIILPYNETVPGIHISLGYPGPGFFTGEDPRSDSRLMNALERVGKLK